MQEKLIIIGGGGHARVLADVAALSGNYHFIGYTDFQPCEGMELPYLGSDEVIAGYPTDDICLVNGIGSIGIPIRRRETFICFVKKGYRFAGVIHEQSIISVKSTLSEGVQIMGGAVINAGAVVRENVIINTSVTVEHDCDIGAHTHIATGVILSGGVYIGEGCHIGTGTIVIQGIKIGDGVLIGAGSLVIGNIPSGVKAYGSPANIVR